MATTDTAVSDTETHGHDDHHDHPPFLAHHFETPEQQFDAGKLGMWLFLVTEVLFFSGLFCAYAVYRMLRPEVFVGCSEFLNTTLGAINTGVLLFSSLTMAWAVRAAQTESYKVLTGMLTATLSCASIFLGVKAVEYSHKWDMGLFPAGYYNYDPNAHPEGLSPYLIGISLPFVLALVGLLIWWAVAQSQKNAFHLQIVKPLVIVAAAYFGGVVLGAFLEAGDDHADAHAAEHASEGHASEQHEPVMTAPLDAAGQRVAAATAPGGTSLPTSDTALQRTAEQQTNTGARQKLQAQERHERLAGGGIVVDRAAAPSPHEAETRSVNTPSRAGVFFSIYYVMTGIHAIHILAGMGVLIWLLVRSVRMDFNRHYFGPVDYVGLYWHIVDLIWIYLFPLLYLIR